MDHRSKTPFQKSQLRFTAQQPPHRFLPKPPAPGLLLPGKVALLPSSPLVLKPPAVGKSSGALCPWRGLRGTCRRGNPLLVRQVRSAPQPDLLCMTDTKDTFASCPKCLLSDLPCSPPKFLQQQHCFLTL